MSRLAGLVWLLLGFSLLQQTARAAPDETSAGSPAYTRAVDGALEEYQLGHYEEARSLFERAHAIEPNARTLRGLGMVEFELRHYLRATTLLEQALQSAQKPLTSEQRESVQALLGRARQFIARYSLLITPKSPTSQLEVDGQRVELPADGMLSLEAGEHTLRFFAQGFVTRELSIDAKGGDQQPLQIDLAAAAQAQAEAVAPAPVSQALPVETRPYRKLGIALTSVGAIALATGGVLGGVALARAESSNQRGDSAAELAHTLAISADTALAVGIVSAIAGTVCLLYRREARPLSARAREGELRQRALAGVQLRSFFPTVQLSF